MRELDSYIIIKVNHIIHIPVGIGRGDSEVLGAVVDVCGVGITVGVGSICILHPLLRSQ